MQETKQRKSRLQHSMTFLISFAELKELALLKQLLILRSFQLNGAHLRY